MFKYMKLAALAVLLCVGFTACEDDEDIQVPPYPVAPSYSTDEVYALIQGNQFGQVGGAIDKLNLSEHTTAPFYFKAVNQQELGLGPQEGIHYGSHIYVSVQGENLIWVLDAQTLQIKKQIQSVSQPTALCATEGYVFVTSYDKGIVTRIDTVGFRESGTPISVGPNPDGITAYGNKVYVSVSDGFNGDNGFINGKKVVEINARQMSVNKEYAVDVNVGQIKANNIGEVYVVSRGGYYGNPPAKVQQIRLDGTVNDFADGSLIAVDGVYLYTIDMQVDWTTNSAAVQIARINTVDKKTDTDFIQKEDLPAYPSNIAVHPNTHHIFICSDKSPNDFNKNGWIYEYSENGKLLHRYDVGMHPYGVIFK